MKRFKPNERVQLYTDILSFLCIISEEMEQEIENGEYEDIILESPSTRNQKKICKRLPDPVERITILALTAKHMSDKRKTDDRNILFSLSRIPYFLFPNFSEENISFYSQAELNEVLEFNDLFMRNLPQYSPRLDNSLLVLIKIEYFVNVYLYFAKAMLEKRYPFGKEYYNFIVFIIYEFYTALKPLIENEKEEFRNNFAIFNLFLDYTTIVYIIENFPEQTGELIYILNNIPKLNLTKEEKELLQEILEDSILISKKEKNKLKIRFT